MLLRNLLVILVRHITMPSWPTHGVGVAISEGVSSRFMVNSKPSVTVPWSAHGKRLGDMKPSRSRQVISWLIVATAISLSALVTEEFFVFIVLLLYVRPDLLEKEASDQMAKQLLKNSQSTRCRKVSASNNSPAPKPNSMAFNFPSKTTPG